ncbi:hypothetical protein LSAT2_006827 [Lamellibrachia satsuma]|nr:hypothetical protein LSAT2_006827 [Lamellibrachia satsuma]
MLFIKSFIFVFFRPCASPRRSVIDVSELSLICALVGSRRPRLLISGGGARSPLSRLLPVVACVSGGRLLFGPFHAAVRLTCRYMFGHRKKDYSRSMGLGLGAVHPKLSGSTIDTETRERVKWGLSSYATESQSIVCRTVEGYHVR